MVSVTTTHVFHCSAKAAIDNTNTNEHDGVPIKFYRH